MLTVKTQFLPHCKVITITDATRETETTAPLDTDTAEALRQTAAEMKQRARRLSEKAAFLSEAADTLETTT